MPNLSHGEEQEQKHAADQVLEKTAGQDSRQREQERGPMMQLAREVDLKVKLDKMKLGTSLDVDALKREATSAIEKMERSLATDKAKAMDSIRPAGPDAAQSQRESLEQSQANQRREQLEKVAKSLNDAVRSVEFARESMLGRHQDTTADFPRKLEAERIKAIANDQKNDQFTPSERLDREQRYGADVDERRVVLAQRQIDEASRLEKFISDMHQASLSFARDVQASLAQDSGLSNEQWLQQSQARQQKFDQQRELLVAAENIWYGRLSDVEALERTWLRASQGKSKDADGFEEARKEFWKILNDARKETRKEDQRNLTPEEMERKEAKRRQQDDAEQVVRLIDKLGVEWKDGTSAPLLGKANQKVEEQRQADAKGDKQAGEWVKKYEDSVRITIDHIADKKAHPEVTLDPSNLQFKTGSDNSARGNSYDVTESWKVDFERSEKEQAALEKNRDRDRGNSSKKSYGRIEDMDFDLPEKLKLAQMRASTDHQRDLNAADEAGASRLTQLRSGSLRQIDGENENQRRDRQEQLLKAAETFHAEQHQQIKGLQTFEHRLHATQRLELSQAQANSSDASASKEVFQRSAEDRKRFEQVWLAMDRKRNADTAQLLLAFKAATSDAREDAIKLAYEKQQQTKQAQEALLKEYERDRRGRD